MSWWGVRNVGNLLLKWLRKLEEWNLAILINQTASIIQKVLAFLLGNMEEKNKKDEPIGYFRVDAEFISKLNQILIENYVIERFRKVIIDEFLKLIKSSIVKKWVCVNTHFFLWLKLLL